MEIYIDKSEANNYLFLACIDIKDSIVLRRNNNVYEYAIVDDDIDFLMSLMHKDTLAYKYVKFLVCGIKNCNCIKDDFHKPTLRYTKLNENNYDSEKLQWNALEEYQNEFIDNNLSSIFDI